MPHPISHFARWLLIVPLGIAGGWAGIIAAIALHGISTRLCPSELLISGMCTAWWFRYAELMSFCLGAAFGAVLVVALPSLAAPRFHKRVAIVAFGAGVIYASYFLLRAGVSVLVPFAFAVVAGLLVVWCIHVRLRSEP